MKRIFYISMMSLLSMMTVVSVYFVTIYGLVVNRIIPLRHILCFTDIALSREVFIIMALIGVLIGYRAGKRWWQIIYVDGVYYFNKAKNPETKTPIIPRRRRAIKKTEE